MGPAGVSSSQRVDQWLWFARITKSRTLAQDLISRGKVRLNREKIDKPSTLVKPGDVLTLVVGPAVRSLEIVGIGHRRGGGRGVGSGRSGSCGAPRQRVCLC